MKLKDIPKEELESMNYDDIAYIILTEQKRKMKIQDLFKKICDALGLSDAEFENQIGDFFEIMSTDKRFTMLENGTWDLRINHSQKLVLDEEDDEEEEIEIEEDEEEENEEDEDIFYEDNPDDDEAEDDLKDLVVIDEEEANE